VYLGAILLCVLSVRGGFPNLLFLCKIYLYTYLADYSYVKHDRLMDAIRTRTALPIQHFLLTSHEESTRCEARQEQHAKLIEQFQTSVEHQHDTDREYGPALPLLVQRNSNALRRYCVQESFHFCKTCHAFSSVDILPGCLKRKNAKASGVTACKHCKGRYTIPRLDRFPNRISASLSWEDQRLLSEFGIHLGKSHYIVHSADSALIFNKT